MARKRFGPLLIVLCWLYEARYVFLTWLASVFVAIATTWWMGLTFRQRSIVIAAFVFAFGLMMFVGFIGHLLSGDSCPHCQRNCNFKPVKLDHARIRREVLAELEERERASEQER